MTPDGDPATRQPAKQGGDPACWLGRVCGECGQLADGESPTRCRRCGAEITRD